MAEGKEGIVRVGSRSSQLAMIQTRTIVDRLKELHPSLDFQIKTMKTVGDLVLDKPLSNIGQANLFTKELEVALASGQVDMIIHSLKDLPTTLPEGMELAVVYERDNPSDCLILHPRHAGLTMETLPLGSVIGTSSLRRVAQLKRLYPSHQYKTIRGNLNTRLFKLDDGNEYDAIVLATAGVQRMGWTERVSQELGGCLYAVGQGALAVETRSGDSRTIDIVKVLNDPCTLLCCSAEREFLKVLGGGCSVPVGVCSRLVEDSGRFSIEGAVLSLDGSEMVSGTVEGTAPPGFGSSVDVCRDFGRQMGGELAKELIGKGALEILRKAKEETDKKTKELSDQ